MAKKYGFDHKSKDPFKEEMEKTIAEHKKKLAGEAEKKKKGGKK